MERKSPLRWKKETSRVYGAPEVHVLRRDGLDLARVQRKKDGTWFWYGMNVNAVHRPIPSLEEAKREAAHYIRTRQS